jgi:flagellar operon protein
MADRPFLYPNVTSVPGSRIDGDKLEKKKPEGLKSDFDHVMDSTLEVREQTRIPSVGKGIQPQVGPGTEKGLPGEAELATLDRAGGLTKDLGAIKQPLKFSAHASQRLAERKITLDSATMTKVSDAIDRAEAKGIEDTLVLTNDAALIVNVKNRTVITAMDKQSLKGNVFTNIDGAVIV